MGNNLLADNGRNIWQSQPPEEIIVSVEELQKRSARLKARMRRGSVIWVAAGAIQIVVSIARPYLEDLAIAPWVAALDFVSVVVVLLYWPYLSTMTRGPISLGLTAGSTPSLEFYRQRLELQRDFLRYDYGGIPKLLVAVFALVLFGVKYPLIMIPMGSAAMIWGMISYLRMKRGSPAIQRELNELDTFRRAQE